MDFKVHCQWLISLFDRLLDCVCLHSFISSGPSFRCHLRVRVHRLYYQGLGLHICKLKWLRSHLHRSFENRDALCLGRLIMSPKCVCLGVSIHHNRATLLCLGIASTVVSGTDSV